MINHSFSTELKSIKKYVFVAIITVFFACSSSIQAADKNIKVGMTMPRSIMVEYEQKLAIPMLSAFINYGAGNVSIESEKTSINGLGLGARFNIPILGYIGLGYGVLNLDYSYNQTVTKGSVQG